MAKREGRVPDSLGGERIDSAVAQMFEGISRRQARRLIDDGSVFIDAQRVRVQSRPVAAGALVSLETRALDGAPSPQEDAAHTRFTVLHDDGDIVVVNKPAGMPTEPTQQASRGTLLVELKDALRRAGKPSPELRAVHRLDTDTTGLVVFARSAAVAAALAAQFQDHSAERRYLALVNGDPRFVVHRLDTPLSRPQGPQRRVVADANGQPSVSHAVVVLRLRAEGNRAALLFCSPYTGRTHQLRVHLADAGLPLIGDRRYGDGRAPVLGLHAVALGFVHPGTSRWVRYGAPPPPAFLSAAQALGAGAVTLERVVARCIRPSADVAAGAA